MIAVKANNEKREKMEYKTAAEGVQTSRRRGKKIKPSKKNLVETSSKSSNCTDR